MDEKTKEMDVKREEDDDDDDLKMPSEIFDCHYQTDLADPHKLAPPGEFYFESDHEALRGNPDYHILLRTLAVLHAKKIQAVKDIETLLIKRDDALKDPKSFMKKLTQGEEVGLPKSQRVPEVPDIDWDKYNLPSLSHVIHKPDTRNKNPSDATTSSSGASEPLERVEGLGCKLERNSKGQFLVRGRVFDETKPQTFNQPWTPEEQRRLEELLVEYPSEDVEMERWKKIATCLGNRTPVQVQSRVQKYFLKLQKAGLPVPGKLRKHNTTNLGLSRIKKPTNRGKYSNSLLGARNSSFFPDLKPDVKMTDDDEREADSSIVSGDSSSLWTQMPEYEKPGSQGGHFKLADSMTYYVVQDDVSDEEDIPDEMRDSAEYKQLMWLKRVRREREMELQEQSETMSTNMFVHTGYTCDGCGQEPIRGGRFTCIDCSKSAEDTVDFCCECVPKNLTVGNHHTTDHVMKPVRKKVTESLPETFDKDYIVRHNYTHPNYVE